MAQATLLDIAKLNGNDAVIGLIEENRTSAPEVDVFPARTIKGTSYKIGVRDSFPGVGFRPANGGVPYTKSTYENRTFETFILSGNIRADVAVADAYEDGPDAFMALEASGIMKQSLIDIGSQIFYGLAADSLGFPGLQAIHTTYSALLTSQGISPLMVDAGGTSANTGSSVYGVKFGEQDVQLILGRGNAFTLGEWFQQMVNDGNAGQDYLAWVASLNAWIGLQVGSKYSVSRLKDATDDANCGVTDAKLAALLAKHPVGSRPDRWFMSRRSAYQLQLSRTATSNTSGAGAVPLAAYPDSSNGIPITVTDSLVDTEALS